MQNEMKYKVGDRVKIRDLYDLDDDISNLVDCVMIDYSGKIGTITDVYDEDYSVSFKDGDDGVIDGWIEEMISNPTNLEKIQAMGVDEMTKFIFGDCCKRCVYNGDYDFCLAASSDDCKQGIKEYLMQEVKDE